MESTLSEKVYNGIIEEIVTGKLTSSSVIRERELIEQFGMSKSPVREALVMLCSNNILYSIPRYGYKVKATDRDYFEGVQRLRMVAEPAYLDIHFDRLNKTAIDRIRRKQKKFSKEIFLDPMKYWEITSQFHLDLAEEYHDTYYYEMLEKMLSQELVSFSQLYWYDWENVIDRKLEDNHSVILDLIEEGKKEEAIEALKADIATF